MARVTIIVPTHRRPGMLTECLTSIKRQTFRDFVVLVCDNSQGREAEQVVESLSDERFIYVPRERNLGIFNNVLEGFRAARSPLVMEVDDDDALYWNCLSDLVAPFDRDPNLALSFGDLEVVDAEGEALPTWRRREFIPDRQNLVEGRIQPFTAIAARGWVFMIAALLRRDAVDWMAVPPESGTAYDRYIGLAASRCGTAAFYVPRPVMAYRVHKASDGLVYSSPQLLGALYVLEAEMSRANVDSRKVLANEIVRTRLLLCATHMQKRDARSAWQAAAPLLRSSEVQGNARAVLIMYGPRQLRKIARRIYRAFLRRTVLAPDVDDLVGTSGG